MIDFCDERSVQQAVAVLCRKASLEDIEKLLANEASMFSLINNLQDKKISPVLRKVSFCLVLILLHRWKTLRSEIDLPNLIFTAFKFMEGFFFISFGHSQESREFFVKFKEEFQSKSEEPHCLMLFAPNKFLSERRIYELKMEDIQRIADARNWEKMIDPQCCQCWIRIPNKDKIIRRKPTLELLESGDSDDRSSVALRLMSRNSKNQEVKKISKSTTTSEKKESIFKRLQDQPANSKNNDSESSGCESPCAPNRKPPIIAHNIKTKPDSSKLLFVQRHAKPVNTANPIRTTDPLLPSKRTFTTFTPQLHEQTEAEQDDQLKLLPKDSGLRNPFQDDIGPKSKLDKYANFKVSQRFFPN